MKRICIKCQSCFQRKNKKYIINLSPAELAQGAVKGLEIICMKYHYIKTYLLGKKCLEMPSADFSQHAKR